MSGDFVSCVQGFCWESLKRTVLNRARRWQDEYACCIDMPAEDERIFRYLKGETLDVGALTSAKEKGWRLVCVDGYPLGWGKLSGGLLKNKYLPGWRLCG